MAPTLGPFVVCLPPNFHDAPVAQWKRSRLVIDRLAVRIRSGALFLIIDSQPVNPMGINAALAWVLSAIGGVGESLKPPDCKSGVRKGFVGSNPTPSTIYNKE